MRIKQEPSSPAPTIPVTSAPIVQVKLEPVDEPHEDEESVMGEGEFIVERILAKEKLFNQAGQESGDGFLVRWLGYGPEYDTWEPRVGLEQGSGQMLRQFEAQGAFISIAMPRPSGWSG